jgi:hypothetical protein
MRRRKIKHFTSRKREKEQDFRLTSRSFRHGNCEFALLRIPTS